MEQKTPLYAAHIALGAKMVPFAGYVMPVQYSSIMAEHRAVRTACGIFDVSHMGEFTLWGRQALDNLNRLLTNDFSTLAVGKARYSPMCYEHGGTVDDLLVYRTGENSYMIVVNASNREKDLGHMLSHLTGDAKLKDVSDEYALLAVQGPAAAELLKAYCALPEKYYSFIETEVLGSPAIVSRTGYTGEDGFEIYCKAEAAEPVMNALVQSGAVPCGLGARDTLRLEAAMPLYGHELTEEITPLEAGLSRFVKMEKPDFMGREALASPPRRRLIGIEITDKGIARQGDTVLSGERKIGAVTSGTFSPTFNKAIAMALVESGADTGGLKADVRGRILNARETPLPFYHR
jgi:aminomethyltransferase